ncbi:MAG: ABC transporter permease [Bacilli bacterium]|nr:ABC transporter permease [Bacilli bacterium]
MVIKKAYLKSTARLFKKHIVRLLSIAAIFVVTVALDSGLGDVETDIKKSINASYHEDEIHDFVIRGYGIEDIKNEIDKEKGNLDVAKTDLFYTFDSPDKRINTDRFAKRIIYRDFSNENSLDHLTLLAGHLPTSANEIVVERETVDIINHRLNEDISYEAWFYDVPIGTISATVVGIVKNPTMVAMRNDPSDYVETGKNQQIDDVFYYDIKYIDENVDPTLKSLTGALNIKLTDPIRKTFKGYSNKYESQIKATRSKIEELGSVKTSQAKVLSLYENFSLYSLNSYAAKVGNIALIFIIFFILIAILVIYSTMSRLLDEQRSSTATLKTLGYSNLAIGMRFVIFGLVAGIIGIAISVAPARLVTSVIINAFTIQYAMKAITFPVVGSFFFIMAGIVLVSSLTLILIKSIKMADAKPVELLTHKAPKVGKMILLERCKKLWNKMSFKFKSTWRNVFLFKARLLMTVLSIVASTILVYASFSLLDCTIANRDKGLDALFFISLILIVFSGALCALVVYNITNINISERTREIATLMVSGYTDQEVTGYVFREIYILTIMGAILGLPAGVGFMAFVYHYIDAPILAFKFVNWWTYLLAPVVTCLFAVLATFLLRRKIIKTDMNESLKVLE